MTTSGRPVLDIDIKRIRRLRDLGLGWRQVAETYTGLTGQYISKDTAKRRYGGFAPIMRRRKERIERVAMTLVSRTYADSNASYDVAWIVRLVDNGVSFNAVAALYRHRTGRRICHKTIKRQYLKAKQHAV